MDDIDFGFEGEHLADALMAGVNFNEISEGWVLGTLLESPETIKELLADKAFPMTKDQVEQIYRELLSDQIITEDYLVRDLSDAEYTEDHVVEMLRMTFTRMLDERHS